MASTAGGGGVVSCVAGSVVEDGVGVAPVSGPGPPTQTPHAHHKLKLTHRNDNLLVKSSSIEYNSQLSVYSEI